jgi:hypothetical protein
MKKFLEIINTDSFVIKNFYIGEPYDFDLSNEDENINRVDALRLVLIFLQKEILSANQDLFFDVKREDPYADYIFTALKLKWISGSSEALRIQKYFSPYETMNLCSALNMLFKAFHVDIEESSDKTIWYEDDFRYAYDKGLILKDLNDNPERNLTLGEFIELMVKVYDLQ